MGANDGLFSFGENDGHIGTKAKAWKADNGQTYRMSFAWWPLDAEGKPVLSVEAETGEVDAAGNKIKVRKSAAPQFSGGPTNFIQGVGYVINDGPEITKLAGGEPPRQRIVTVIVLWPTNKKGEIQKERLAEFEVKPWVINAEKYRTLEQLHREWGFGDVDITARCEENGAQFQKLTFAVCKENLYQKMLANPKAVELTNRIVEEVAHITSNIREFVGRKMTAQQIREKLAGGGQPVARDVGDSAVADSAISDVVAGLLDN